MPNAIDLSGRIAVITGAAQGIGRAIAERFLHCGATVRLWDRDGAAAKTAAAELGALGPVLSTVVDVADAAGVAAAASEATGHGRIDILVNNAGIAGANVPTWDYPSRGMGAGARDQPHRHVQLLQGGGADHDRPEIRPHRQHRLDRRQGRQPQCPRLFGLQGRRHRADEVARQGARRLRHLGQLHHAGGGEDRDLRPDDDRAHRLHALQESRADVSSWWRRSPTLAAFCASQECAFTTGAVFDISGGRATY